MDQPLTNVCVVSNTKVVLFGGGVREPALAELAPNTFTLDTTTYHWTKLACGSMVPSPRTVHAAEKVGDLQMVVYGGSGKGKARS